jgi:cell division protein FtsW
VSRKNANIADKTTEPAKKVMKAADKWLLFAVLSLMFMSLVVVYSASASWAELRFQNPAYLLRSHLFKVMIGMVLIFVIAKVDYHKYQKFAIHLVVISAFLVMVAIGQRVIIKGAARWIHLGIFSFEPSEIARIAILFFTASYLAQNADKLDDYRNLMVPVLATVVVAGFIVLEPNFSTALMILAVVGVMFIAGGVKKTHIAALVGAAVVIGAVVLVFEAYRVHRIETWMHHGAGSYQVRQSIIGFGNGGIFGVGPGNSKQRNLFLPESYGDFIYSIIGEEYGLWGSTLILLIFLFLAFRGTAIAKKAPDRFGYLLATGITSAICFYAFINAGVAIGLFPTTGLPMPFVSYGGTAMIINSFAVGILLNISKQIPSEAELSLSDKNPVEIPERKPVRKSRPRSDEPVVGRIYS